jgi:hypothetical protein
MHKLGRQQSIALHLSLGVGATCIAFSVDIDSGSHTNAVEVSRNLVTQGQTDDG